MSCSNNEVDLLANEYFMCGYGNIWFFTMIILQFQQLDVIAYSMNVKYIYDYVNK